MTLRRFTEAAYALLVEAWMRLPHIDLLTAVEKVDESIGLSLRNAEASGERPVRQPSPADNERALHELMKLTSGMVKAR